MKKIEKYLDSNKMQVYVDMDGTLVDFVSQIDIYGYWRKNKPDKIQWNKVIKQGPAFWNEMDWLPGAEIAFKELQNFASKGYFDLYILSSIDFEEGREGKKMWIKSHTDFPIENAIFVEEPEDKAFFADKRSWLIDDRKKSLEPFAAKGGNIIEFKGDWNNVRIELNKSPQLEKKLPVLLCWFKEFETEEHIGSIRDHFVDKVPYSKESVINYLKKGRKQASCPREIFEPITKEKMADYFSVYTDEEYYWIDLLPYLIEKYNIRLPEAFVMKCNGNTITGNDN